MSLLIKGMDMPKNCYHCRFNYDGLCHALRSSFSYIHENDISCPLVEIPTPHGDLIDRNLLLKEYEPNPEDDQRMKEESFKDYVLMEKIVGIVTENINEMPIIIEAED